MPPGIVPSTTAIPPGIRPTEAPVLTPAQLRLQRLRQSQTQVSPAAASMEPADLGVTDPFADPFFTADEPPEQPGMFEGVNWPTSFLEAMKGDYLFEAAERLVPSAIKGAVGTFIPGIDQATRLLPDPA